MGGIMINNSVVDLVSMLGTFSIFAIFLILLMRISNKEQKYKELSEIEPKKVKIMGKPYHQCVYCGFIQDRPFNRILIEGYGSSVGCVCSTECLDKMLNI